MRLFMRFRLSMWIAMGLGLALAGGAAAQRPSMPVNQATPTQGYDSTSMCRGCHDDIVAQHLKSSHEMSFTNPTFQAQYQKDLLPKAEKDADEARRARTLVPTDVVAHQMLAVGDYQRALEYFVKSRELVPPDPVDRLRLIPSVERAHALTVGEAPLPKPRAETAMAAASQCVPPRPRTTALMDSPNTIMVKSPNRSGMCEGLTAAVGCMLRQTCQGTASSRPRLAAQKRYLAGAASGIESAQRAAPTPNPLR